MGIEFSPSIATPIGSTLGGSGVSNAGTFTWGANNIVFTTSGATSVTLPTTGTLATRAGAEALTNKTYAGSTATLSGIVTANGANSGALAVLGGTPSAESTESGLWLGVTTPSTLNPTLKYVPGVGQLQIQAPSEMRLCIGNTNTIYVQIASSQVNLVSGITLQLGNTATTGLTAGVLAALTNASVTMKDANGTLYRIPCIV